MNVQESGEIKQKEKLNQRNKAKEEAKNQK